MYLFFNDTATTEIYTYGHTLSLHDALPICGVEIGDLKVRIGPDRVRERSRILGELRRAERPHVLDPLDRGRSEEHTSELQSLMRISYAVFCLKKKTHTTTHYALLSPQM